MKRPADPVRRRFLSGVLAGLGALGLARRARARPRPEPGRESLFRRTPHVETYYRTLED